MMKRKLTVATRVTGEIRTALEDQADLEDKTISEVLYDAILRYLNDDWADTVEEPEAEDDDEMPFEGEVMTSINSIIVDAYQSQPIVDENNPVDFYELAAQYFREQEEDEYDYTGTESYRSLLPAKWQITVAAIIEKVLATHDEEAYAEILEDLSVAFTKAAQTARAELSQIVLRYPDSTRQAIQELIDYLRGNGVLIDTPNELCNYLIGKKLLFAGRANILFPNYRLMEEGKEMLAPF